MSSRLVHAVAADTSGWTALVTWEGDTVNCSPAETKIAAARPVHRDAIETAWQATRDGTGATPTQLIAVNTASVYAVETCAEVITDLFRYGGGRASKRRDGREHYPPMSEQNTCVFEVLIGQIAKRRNIYAIFGKTLRVLGHAEPFKPVRNLLHRGPTVIIFRAAELKEQSLSALLT